MSSISLFPAIQVSASGLKVERTRMEVAVSNLANANSTDAGDGNLYQRQAVVVAPSYEETAAGVSKVAGVHIESIISEDREPVQIYAPHHPGADANGMVKKPNISPMEEMIDMITATRAYEANLSAMRQSRDMAKETIQLGRQNG